MCYESQEKHVEHLRIVLQTPRHEKLYGKFNKCEFLLDKIIFLGQRVSGEGISVDARKVEVVLDWPIPNWLLRFVVFSVWWDTTEGSCSTSPRL